jgi:hypothetical protein
MTVTETVGTSEDKRDARLTALAEVYLEHGLFPDPDDAENPDMAAALAARIRELRASRAQVIQLPRRTGPLSGGDGAA